jgi:hypothetical protein
MNRVGAGAAVGAVGAPMNLDHVVPGAGKDDVVSAAPVDVIVAAEPAEDITPRGAVEFVGTGRADVADVARSLLRSTKERTSRGTVRPSAGRSRGECRRGLCTLALVGAAGRSDQRDRAGEDDQSKTGGNDEPSAQLALQPVVRENGLSDCRPVTTLPIGHGPGGRSRYVRFRRSRSRRCRTRQSGETGRRRAFRRG